MPPIPARSSRSHASCTASSASARDPSMRYATALRCARFASNSAASKSWVPMPSHSLLTFRHPHDERKRAHVTMTWPSTNDQHAGSAGAGGDPR
jgi:hypothetical protein